jgi:hypothetical protein
MHFLEASALTTENINKLFEKMSKVLLNGIHNETIDLLTNPGIDCF